MMTETATATSEEKQDLDGVPLEVDASPAAGGLVLTSKQSIEDIIFLADNVDRIIAAHNKIRLAIVKLTQPSDWSKWGDTGEIGFAGANRVGSTIGVNFTNWSSEKITGHDDYGDWYRWEYQCDASFKTQTVRVYGRFGSRDKLLGFERGEWKELKDIDEGNIKIAAMRAAKKEGVKDLFGLHSMDLAFLKTNGIDLTAAKGYAHQSKDQKAEATQTAVITVKEVFVKSSKPEDKKQWKKYSVQAVEGAVYGTFDEKLATIAKGLVGKKATVNFTVGGFGNDLSSIEAVPA